ncbi:MAG: hypothetical protein HYX54_08015 [Chloroflexi bacterium]|nr:hypothetical protein [Chloroflexota bacterium]
MDVSGFIVLVVGGAVLGLIGQYAIQGARFGYEWVVTGIGAIVGGFVASEVINLQNWSDVGGLLLVPALIGGLVGGAIVWLVARNVGSETVSRAT